MEITYSPSISKISGCDIDFLSYLSEKLIHQMSEDSVKSILNTTNNLTPITKEYLFKTTRHNNNSSSDLFDVYFYSGFIIDILSDLHHNKTTLNKDNLVFINNKIKYEVASYIPSSYLYEHQKTIVETCLKRKRGIVKSPTSSGKSFSISELIRIINTDKPQFNILITVPTISLLHQLTKDIKDFYELLGLDIPSIGQIGDGVYDIQSITVGIPNSLTKLDKVLDKSQYFSIKSYLNKVDILIVDECHTIANGMFCNIMNNLCNISMAFGFSATPWTNDGSHNLLKSMLGPLIIDIDETEMIRNDVILQPVFEFYNVPPYPLQYLPDYLRKDANNITGLTDGHRYMTLNKMYNFLIINHTQRNDLIITKAIERIDLNNGPVLIIVNKVKGEDENHAAILQDLFKSKGYDLPILSGYVPKKKRNQIIDSLKNYSIPGVIAGPRVLTAGISINNLSTIILANSGKSDSDFIQRVGRLLRKDHNKEHPLVIDFNDTQYWFKNQSYSRMKTAKSVYGNENIKVI